MSEELMHVIDSSIMDVVVKGRVVTTYFFGGTSSDELETGGRALDMYDMSIQFPSEVEAMQARGLLVKWYSANVPVSVVAYENGNALITNQQSQACLRVTYSE